MMTKALTRSIIALHLACVSFASIPVEAQIIINQTQAPTTLVQNTLMGPGVFASNVTFCGAPGSMVAPVGMGPSEIGRFNGANTSLGFASGVFLCPGVALAHIPGPNIQLQGSGGGVSAPQGIVTPDIDLGHLTGYPYWQISDPPGNNIYNKSILEFDFIPINDMVSVRYVFSSEEYERWACTQYNDVFGFFISGPGIPTDINGPFTNGAMNIALIPGSLSRVSINSVNSGLMDANNANGFWTDPFAACFQADSNWQANAQYYRYNGGLWPYPQPPSDAPQTEAPYNSDPYYIQHNGMTVVLTASAAVQCGETYHVKLGVANVGDSKYPSAVFLEGGSFTSTDRFTLTVDPAVNVEYNATDTTLIEYDCDSVYLRFHRLGGFYLDEDLTITMGGTATGGVDYLPALPTLVHFNQLDSFAIVAIAVPVDIDGLEELIVNIVTCNGSKIKTFTYPIDQRPPLQVILDDQALTCPAVVTLTPQVTGSSNDGALFNYLWSTGETTPSISPMVMTTTHFWVTVSDSCWAASVTDSAWVTVPPYDPMVLTLSPDTAIPCLGQADLQVAAELGAGQYTYSWTLNGQVQGTSTTLNVPAAQPSVYYVVAVTDLCGVVATDSVLISWAPASPLVLSATPDITIACLGQAELEAFATGGGGTLQYIWQNNGVVVGTIPTLTILAAVNEVYTVAVSDECGQSAQAQVLVNTGPTPPLVFTAVGDTVLCAGMQMAMNVISVNGGGGAYSYAWSPGGTGPANGSSLEVSVQDDSPFTITVTDQCGNQADTTVMAVILDHDPIVLEVPNDTIVCPGSEVSLWVIIAGGAGENQIDWPGIGSGPSVNWTAINGGGNITVEVTDACGSVATASTFISTFPAGVSIDATELVEEVWRFQGITDPATGNLLEWDLGDGATSTDMNVTHTYTDQLAHWVVLTIVTPDGCVAVDSVFTPPPTATLYFPNTFTPDGDGTNDSFGAEGRLIGQYELLIFDRWGAMIFESHRLEDRWDGRVGGEEPVTGIYAYRYRAEGLSMPIRQGFGHITLLR